MEEYKIKEIEYWIHCEIKINGGNIRQQCLIDKAQKNGFTSMQVLSVLDHILDLGLYFEPISGIIEKVSNPFILGNYHKINVVKGG